MQQGCVLPPLQRLPAARRRAAAGVQDGGARPTAPPSAARHVAAGSPCWPSQTPCSRPLPWPSQLCALSSLVAARRAAPHVQLCSRPAACSRSSSHHHQRHYQHPASSGGGLSGVGAGAGQRCQHHQQQQLPWLPHSPPPHHHQQHQQHQPQPPAAQPRHSGEAPHPYFSAAAAHAAISAAAAASNNSGGEATTSGGGLGGGPAAFVGASAKALLQTAVHSLDMFEPRLDASYSSSATTSSGSGGGGSGSGSGMGSSGGVGIGSFFEDHEGSGLMLESFEEGVGLPAGAAATAHIVKANYEVLRLDEAGGVRRLRIKRRDLLREHRLQPRDLRRIDPSIDFTKASPSITIKEDVLLLNLGGVRAIVTGDKALLFEPASSNTRKLLDTLVPRLQASAGQRLLARQQQQQAAAAAAAGAGGQLEAGGGSSSGSNARQTGSRAPPFELEVLEGVLMVATGRLDAEVLAVTRRVGELLQKLPRDINPVNLEELRRIKQALVELENKADMLREMLEQIMDDEDELREINLSSRPRREERRKQRERERMERQLTRAREEMQEQARRNSGADGDDRRGGSSSSGGSSAGGGSGGGPEAGPSSSSRPTSPTTPGGGSSTSSSNGAGGVWQPQQQPQQHMQAQQPQQQLVFPNAPGSSGRMTGLGGGAAPASGGSGSTGSGSGSTGAAARQQRLAELYARHGLRRGPGGVLVPGGSGSGRTDSKWEEWRPVFTDGRADGSSSSSSSSSGARGDRERDREREREGDPEEEFQDAQDALEELAEQEEEEEELEEVEDLLEYYLQRSSATQSEAERLLEGARDLEESIGVSLSARRYEVNRLELMLSMGSFAAALGAMIAGIFGMNMKSTLEMSVAGFWGVTGSIVVGCFYIFLAIMRYTQKKRIL